MTSPDATEEDRMECVHRFQRRRWFGPKVERWECVWCGFRTRKYDSVDRMATRPVHPHMSVAYPGFNTVPKRRVQDVI